MRSMQDKVLAAIEQQVHRTADAMGVTLEVVQQEGWANTGKVMVQRGFRTLLEVHYNFQHATCTLHIAGERIGSIFTPPKGFRLVEAGTHGGGAEPAGVQQQDRLTAYIDYTDGEMFESLLVLIDSQLLEAANG